MTTEHCDDPVLLLVQNVHSTVQALDVKLTNHMLKEPQELAAALADIMRRGFPDGDVDGHRRAHEAQIKALEDKARFWGKMRFEITKWGLVGFVGWFALNVLWPAVVQAVLAKLHA